MKIIQTEKPLINVLIRVSRQYLYEERCLPSVKAQDYPNVNVIPFFSRGRANGFSYNLYCNHLKNQVTEGWFFYLDDDDILVDQTALTRISRHLFDPDRAIVCQMLRNGRPKPNDTLMDECEVRKGHIGMPCIFLHAKHKDLALFTSTEDADFRFIKEVSQRLAVGFAKEVVVDAGKRSYGSQLINPNIQTRRRKV